MAEESPVIWLLRIVFHYVFLGISTLAEALWVFLVFILTRILDLIILALFLGSLCSVVRTYQSLSSVYVFWCRKKLVSRDTIIDCLFANFFFAIADIFLYGAFFLVLATGWRAPKVWNLWCTRKYDIDFSATDDFDHYRLGWRCDVWKQFYLWCLDLFVVPFGLVVVITGYRIPSLLDHLNNSTSESGARSHVVKEFLHILVDIPCFITGAALCCTWRLPFLVSQSRNIVQGFPQQRFDHNKLRWLPFAQFGIFLCDIPAAISLCVCLLPNVWVLLVRGIVKCNTDYKLKPAKKHPSGLFSVEYAVFWTNFNTVLHYCAVAALADIVAAVGSVVVLLSWRNQHFIKILRKDSPTAQAEIPAVNDNAYDEMLRRRWHWYYVTAVELWNLVVDIPVIILALVVLCCIWRGPKLASQLWRLNWRSDNVSKIRRVALVQAWHTLRDFALLVPLLLVSLTLWRSKYLYKKMGKKIKKTPVDWQDILGTCWKLVLKNFALLLVDAVALPFAAMLLCTWRGPKLLSGWTASGNFYAFFAVTVFVEFGRFVMDIPLAMWFLLMFMLRPYGAVVLLLEDSKHRRQRELCARLPEVHDIIAQRRTINDNLRDMVDLQLKNGRLPVGLSDVYQGRPALYGSRPAVYESRPVLYGDGSRWCGSLDYFVPWAGMQELVRTVAHLQAHKESTQHLSRRYTHLLDQVLAIETKRARKAMRRAHAEFTYMCRPDPHCREENLQLVHVEDTLFDRAAKRAYTKLASFTPPSVPLWTHSSGFSSRTRGQTMRVLVEIATTGYFAEAVLLLCNMGLVYRFPSLVLQLRTRWWMRRELLLRNLWEHVLDLLAVICILITTTGVYRALELYGAIAVSLTEHRSWRRARQNAFASIATCVTDFWDLLAMPFRWGTYTFLTLAMLWGVLVPIDLYQPMAGTGGAVVLWIVFSGFPFLWNFYIVEHTKQDVEHLGGFLLAYAFGFSLCILLSLRALAKKKAFKPAPDFRVVQYNWDNFNTLLAEVIDVLQISALVFLVGIPSTWNRGTNDFAHYMLLNFIPLDVKFWLFVAGFVVWYFIASAPPVLEEVMQGHGDSRIVSEMVLWQLSAYFFTNTVFITMTSTVFDVLSCSYSDTRVVSHADSDLPCWVGEHRAKATFALFAMMWYASTTILYNARYRARSLRQDIQFCALYLTVNNVLKLSMVAVALLFGREKPYVALGTLLALNLFGLAVAGLFENAVGYPICNVPRAVPYKCGAYAATTWLSVVGLVAVANDDVSSALPIVLWLGGWGCVAGAVVVYLWCMPSASSEEISREEVKAALLALEARLFSEGSMLTQWERRRTAWQRKVSMVRSSRWFSRAEYDTLGDVGVHRLLMANPFVQSMTAPPEHGRFGCTREYAFRRLVQTTDGTNTHVGKSGTDGLLDAGHHDQRPLSDIPHRSNESAGNQNGVDVNSDRDYQVPSRERVYRECREEEAPTGDVGFPDPAPAYGPIASGLRSESYEEAVELADEVLPSYAESNAQAPEAPEGLPLGAHNSHAAASEYAVRDYSVFDGQSALLELEENVRFDAVALEFLAVLDAWRRAVEHASWEGMLACLAVLEQSIGRYAHPGQAMTLMASPTDRLESDADEIMLPPFVDYSEETADAAMARSVALKQALLVHLQDTCQCSAAVVDVLDKILPGTAIDGYTPISDGTILVELRNDAKGTIQSVGPAGVSVARGAYLQWRDRIKLVVERYPVEIAFRTGDLRVGKGAIGVSVGAIRDEDNRLVVSAATTFGAKSKALPYSKVLDTVGDIQWNA